MINELLRAGAEIVAYDPEAMENVQGVIGDKIKYASNEYEALENADALMIATEWGEFRNPDFAKMSDLLNAKVIFDGRNLYDLTLMRDNGFYYESIGRNTVHG